MLRIAADDGRRAALAAAVETAERTLQLDSQHVQETDRVGCRTGQPTWGRCAADLLPGAGRASPDRVVYPGRNFAHGCGWGLPPLGLRKPLFRTAWPKA